ncbi:MAG: hypothetical protein LUF34_05930 [Lachnospiraceae bacterium]|nr:hypothetical protein [Lachnospiraceae bacterium]
MSRPGTGKKAGRSVWLTILCAILFHLGLGILLYPTFSSQWNKWRREQLIADYSPSLTELQVSQPLALKPDEETWRGKRV